MDTFFEIPLNDNQSDFIGKWMARDPWSGEIRTFGNLIQLYRGRRGIAFPTNEYFFGNLGWSLSKARGMIRSLYGIYMVERRVIYGDRDDAHTGWFHNWIRVPRRNISPLEKALESDNVFRKEMFAEDFHVLERVYEKDQELNDEYCSRRWTPNFNLTQVSEMAQLKKKGTRQSLDRLTGLLLETRDMTLVQTEDLKRHYQITGIPYWSIPTARIPDVERALDM